MSHQNIMLPASLEDAKITRLPSTAYYIPNFISEEEERLLLDKVCIWRWHCLLSLMAPRSPPRRSHDGSSSLTAGSKHGHRSLFKTDSLIRPCRPGSLNPSSLVFVHYLSHQIHRHTSSTRARTSNQTMFSSMSIHQEPVSCRIS